MIGELFIKVIIKRMIPGIYKNLISGRYNRVFKITTNPKRVVYQNIDLKSNYLYPLMIEDFDSFSKDNKFVRKI